MLLVDNEVSPPTGGGRRRRILRRRGVVPSVEGRTYLHPSELPGDFELLLTTAVEHRPRRFSASIMAVAVLLLGAGSATLIATNTKEPTTEALPAHVARSLLSVPSVGRSAANSLIQLSVNDHGHITATGAIIVGDGHVAVTTLAISKSASITGSTCEKPRVAATWLGRDSHVGLTYVHVRETLSTTSVAPQPATEPVLVISPYFNDHARTPRFAYANTVLSDPRFTTNDGIVSYLSATSPSSLHGITGAVAINDGGDVVAMLSSTGQWFTASYLTEVATAWLQSPNCHGRLGISGVSAEGGGVLVTAVARGPSSGVLRAGDVLSEINGQHIDSFDALTTLLYATPGHSHVRVTFLRHQVTHVAVVKLGCLS